jgi:hypothetical protein
MDIGQSERVEPGAAGPPTLIAYRFVAEAGYCARADDAAR